MNFCFRLDGEMFAQPLRLQFTRQDERKLFRLHNLTPACIMKLITTFT